MTDTSTGPTTTELDKKLSAYEQRTQDIDNLASLLGCAREPNESNAGFAERIDDAIEEKIADIEHWRSELEDIVATFDDDDEDA